MIFSALNSRLHGFGPHLAGLRRRCAVSMSLCSCGLLTYCSSRNHRSAPLRQCAIFSSIFKLICPVQPRPQKYSASSRPQITLTTPAIPSRKRGVGHRHERWGGLRWTRQRQAREVFAGRLSVNEHGAQTNGA